MEFLFEIIFQVFGEFLLQLLFEGLSELGTRSLADRVKAPRSPLLSAIGFMFLGAVAGGLSLLIVPSSPISSLLLRRINLLATPLAVGGMMTLVGRLLDKKGQRVVRLDRFGYAFVFAFAMALVRYIWAH